MSTLTPPQYPGIDRDRLGSWYRRNRERSAQLFSLVDPSAFYSRPIPLRHPFVFYEGHLPAFSFLTLNERSLGEVRIDGALEKLFERGIDPASLDAAQLQARGDWPSEETVSAFARECDLRVEDALANAPIVNPTVPSLERGQAAYTILEHEQMHHETLTYIIHQLSRDKQHPVQHIHRDSTPPRNEFQRIPAGRATLGANIREIPFGWDNDFPKHTVDVPEFSIQTYPITNADWLEFVKAGGPVPIFWSKRDDRWFLRAVFDDIPLPQSWPVYITHDQAAAYAAWKNLRLPTESEFHRAAYSTPNGTERTYPWGNDLGRMLPGNFDFQRYDPEPVDAHPQGASAWGIYDLVGNGWEWTATPFGPFPGFAPMASYPQYSVDFFDGKHYVMKGASPVTAKELVRPSFRNWFYGDYPYMYAKFRCVSA